MMRLYFKRNLKKLRLLVYFMLKTAYEKERSKKEKNVHCQKKRHFQNHVGYMP